MKPDDRKASGVEVEITRISEAGKIAIETGVFPEGLPPESQFALIAASTIPNGIAVDKRELARTTAELMAFFRGDADRALAAIKSGDFEIEWEEVLTSDMLINQESQHDAP